MTIKHRLFFNKSNTRKEIKNEYDFKSHNSPILFTTDNQTLQTGFFYF